MQNRLYFVRLHPFRLCCRSAVHPSRLPRSDRDIIAISRLQPFPLASAASLPAFRRSAILASFDSLPGLYIYHSITAAAFLYSYNIRAKPAQKSQSKKFEKIFQKHLTKQKFSAIIKSRKQRHDKINGGSL